MLTMPACRCSAIPPADSTRPHDLRAGHRLRAQDLVARFQLGGIRLLYPSSWRVPKMGKRPRYVSLTGHYYKFVVC